MFLNSDATLGLDLGSTGLRAIELAWTNGRPSIRRWAVMDFAEDIADWRETDSQEMANRIRSVLRQNDLRAQWAAHSVSGDAVVPQYFNFPQILPEDVPEAVRIEVETALPFPADNAMISYLEFADQQLAPGKIRTHGMAIAADGEFVRSRLEPIRRAGLETFCLEADSTACANAFVVSQDGLRNFVNTDGPNTVAILNIGCRNTNLALLGEERTLLIRDMPWAGATITQAIASELTISPDEAERLKRAHWEKGSDASPELEARLAGLLKDCAEECMGRLKDTIQYWVGERLVPGLGKIALTGGGSQVRGLERVFADEFAVPVERWAPALEMARGHEEAVRPWAARLTVALGLALRQFVTRKS